MSDLEKPVNGSPNLDDEMADELANALASFTDDLLDGNIELTEAEDNLSEDEELRSLQALALRMQRAFGSEEPDPAMSGRIKMNLVTELRKMDFGEAKKPASILVRIQRSLAGIGKGRFNYLMPIAAIAAVFLIVFLFVFGPGAGLFGSVINGYPVSDRQVEVVPLVGVNSRVSVNANGVEVEQDSWYSAVSADGRYIAFVSASDDLAPGDNNGLRDIFVHDQNTGSIERVSLSTSGQEGNGDSINPVISADGRFVAFESQADNLAGGDGNGLRDIFVRDRLLNTTELVSVINGQSANGDSRHPSISDNGRFVTFYSTAPELAANDGNGVGDIFLYDRQSGTMTAVSLTAQGQTGSGESRNPTISGDGQFVAFESEAIDLVANDGNNASDIFLYSRQSGSLQRVSINEENEEGDGPSYNPDLSADGSVIVFQSMAENLWEFDSNNHTDIFIYFRNGSNQVQIERASVALEGGQADGDSGYPSISADGNYVAFSSFATNLAAGEIYGTNLDIFLYDRPGGVVERISADLADQEPDGASVNPDVSADGRFISFDSTATNLVDDDTNNRVDVFVRDRMPLATITINYTDGTPGSYFSVTGSRFSPDSIVSLVINGVELGTVTSDSDGAFDIVLASDNADPGIYILTASAGGEGTVVFVLDPNAAYRPQEPQGAVFNIPPGIAYTNFNSLPVTFGN